MEPLQPGDPRTVGRYALSARLGAGGMGNVYYGRSPGGRPVAVKLVRPEYGADPRFRRRFAREIEAARRVGGFYTAQVVDADPDAEQPWLVTAYVAGPSLGTLVSDEGPLPVDAVRILGASLVEGLMAIHDSGLVHRDLKPGNVVMGADGPRVIDFGIARALDATTATATGAVVGTPAYMSPEQARGQRTGPASDVFSLGAVLAYAATGAAPFGRGTLAAVVYRIVHEAPDLDRVPAQIRELVARCLAKAPESRPGLPELLESFSPVRDDPPDSAPAGKVEQAVSAVSAELATSAYESLTASPEPATTQGIAPDGPRYEFARSKVRELLEPGVLLIYGLSLVSPIGLGVRLVEGKPVSTWFWVAAVGLLAMPIGVIILVLTSDDRLIIDESGLTLTTKDGRHHFPWEEIERVSFHSIGSRTPRWSSNEYLAATPKPDSALPRDRSLHWRPGAEHFWVIEVAGLKGTPHAQISAAVADFTQGRLEVEYTEEPPPEPPIA